ncbi:hypothetical protein Emag_001363 [Eimeria magna]
MRTRWARPKQLEAEAAAATESAAAQSKGDAAAKFLNRISARRRQQQLLRDRAKEDAEVAAPDGLVLDDLVTREDCTTYGWDLKRKQFLKLLDRYGL